MIVIGNKYVFLPSEKDKIEKKEQIKQIKVYSEDEILKLAEENPRELIVLNTPYRFTKQIFPKLKDYNVITIEKFLEEKFQKTYIPRKVTKYFPKLKPYTKFQYFIKRIIDYILGSILLILTFPIMVYSVYRIKKESPNGPIIFKQKRVGLNGKEFTCYKFRSMVPDAEKEIPKFASKDDPRVFKWGAFMRKTRIDELPQIWNVFKGDMHMIGPRPERKYWTDQFEKNIPYYSLRHTVRPGITGWAQVNYPYGANEEDAYQKLMYDVYYIKNWSLSLEIKTILKTILVMIGKKGI